MLALSVQQIKPHVQCVVSPCQPCTCPDCFKPLYTGSNSFTPLVTAFMRTLQVHRVKPYMPFAATVMCVLIIGTMVGTNVEVVRAAGFQIFSAVTVRGSSAIRPKLLLALFT